MCTAKSSSWCWSMRFAMTPSNCPWERLLYETPPRLLLKNVTCHRGWHWGESQERMLIPKIQTYTNSMDLYISEDHVLNNYHQNVAQSWNMKALAQGTTPCPNLAPTSLDGSWVSFLSLYWYVMHNVKNHAYEEVWFGNTWLQHTVKTKNPLKQPTRTNMNHNTSCWNLLNV